MEKFQKVFIEITNICNFRCAFCPIDFQERKPVFMEKILFLKYWTK